MIVALLVVWPASARADDAPRDVPVLTHLVIDGSQVRAATDPDSTGQALWVTYDPKRSEWSLPTYGAQAPAGDSLGGVRVFDGGLFDKFPVPSLALGDGYTLAQRDTGFALLRDSTDLGWPILTEKDIDGWGGKVRQGLPRDYPDDRLRQLLYEKRLRNVPGPTTVLGTTRWFGLKGGFTGGEGQLGGLVAFDPAKGTFDVRRHYLLADVSVTRLYPWRDDLWIGTARFGQNALEGITGLLRYRPSRNEWQQYSLRNSRISGDLVWDIAGTDESIWVTTDGGVSRYNPKQKNWKSWFWRRTKAGDGYELRDRPPGTLAEELIK